MSHWYIVQVFRGSEERILQKAKQDDRYALFYPKRIQIKRVKSENVKEIVPLFPGYIFIETNEDRQHFYRYYAKALSPLEGCVKILKHKEDIDVLWPEEKAWIQSLMNVEKTVDSSKGFKEGDAIIVTEGPLVGLESKLIKIDRHKRIAVLTLEMFGTKHEVEVGLELISKQMI